MISPNVTIRGAITSSAALRDRRDRALHRVANAIELSGSNPRLGDHPRSPAGHDAVEGEVLGDVGRIDAAGGHEPDVGKRRRERTEHRQPAHWLRGEELQHAETVFERGFDVGRRAHTGVDGHPALVAPVDDARVQPGRDDEARAGVSGLCRLFGRQHRARADQHVRPLGGDPAQRLEGSAAFET